MARTLAVTFFVLCLVAGGFAYLGYRKAATWKAKHDELLANTTRVATETLREAEAIRQAAIKDRAETRQERAAVERERVAAIASVKSAADAIRDQELHKIYPSLRPFQSNPFTVNDKYVKEFTVGERFSASGGKSARKVSITYQNDGQKLVQPNVYIYFISERGVVTGYAHDSWLISSVNPGERRVEDAFADFDHGEPVYWTIDVR